ncbi:MAG: flagellin [Verrucomicrobia bacterium]|nr:flagellin [Verrucomicrobiota bacterium]
MRIATNTVSESVLAQIQKLSSQQAKLQSQVSTGQKISLPEDDPSAVGRILTLDSEARQVQQFKVNANRALDVSQATYAGLQDIKKISDRAGEIATLGAGASSPDAYRAYATELNQLVEQALQSGNAKLRNDYIFAGTALSTAPLVATRNVAGDITSVAYAGNAAQTNVQISELSKISPGSDSSTNTGMGAFLNNLIALRDALNTGVSANVSAARPNLDNSENLLVNALSEQGAVQLRIEVAQSQQATRSTNIEKLISNEADADMATSVVKLSQTSTAYEAALSSATKILQMSLLDYLK